MAAIVLILALYRGLVILLGELPLFYDQAYYYYWSLNPDWGYFSKPPVVAWLIALTTGIWGSSELAVDVGAIILYSLTSWVVYLIGRDHFGEREAIWAGISFAAMPVVGFNSLFVSTDAPLMFFWALSVLFFGRAVRSDHWRWWLATGCAAGLGMLSKYSMGVLAVGLLAFLLTSAESRRRLFGRRLWTAVVLAALILLPNILWNARHDFVSFRHTAEISQLDRALFHPDHLLEFFAMQFGVFGPVFMGLFVWLAFRRSSYRSESDRLMIFPALAMLGVIGLQALLSRAYANWAAPAFITATVLVSAWLVRAGRERLLVSALALNLLLLSIFYHYHTFAEAVGAQLRKGQTPYARVLGWRELGAEVSTRNRLHPRAILLSDSRKHLAYLSYYAQPRTMQLAWWGPQGGPARNHYQLVADISKSSADEFVYAGPRLLAPNELAMFGSHEYLGEVAVQPLADLKLSAHLYYLKDFHGYPR
ncbi:MAG: glycosyltransferase family 39 protein [Chromatiaceae bacterium]|nr:glycosyltransferase family 39 protein [Chromatiaceae bacterium]